MKLTGKISIHSLDELVSVLAEVEPENIETICKRVSSKPFRHWLRVHRFSGWQAASEHIDQFVNRLNQHPEQYRLKSDAQNETWLRCYDLLSGFCPNLPFPVADEWLRQPKQLEPLVQGPIAIEGCCHELAATGWLHIWFANLGGTTARDFTKYLTGSDDRRMRQLGETLLEVAGDPAQRMLGRAVFEVLDMGWIRKNQPKCLTIRLQDRNGAPLNGRVSLAYEAQGSAVSVAPTVLRGTHCLVDIKVNAAGCRHGKARQCQLLFQNNGRQRLLLLRFRADSLPRLRWSDPEPTAWYHDVRL